MAKEKGITIEQLYQCCASEIKNGNGKRHIIISGDDEGNSFHELFYGFSPVTDTFPDESMLPYGVTPSQAAKEYITLR